WLGAKRPDILISAEGDAVAVMTPAGRAPSKPRGGSFAVANWLEADGDAEDQAAAAARPLWQGTASDRWAELGRPDGRVPIRHLTGKAARGDAETHCPPGGILVADGNLATGAGSPPCLVLDAAYLRRHG